MDFSNFCFKALKNRGFSVIYSTKAEVVRQISIDELQELVRFYSAYLKTDHIIRLFELWSSELSVDAAKEIFRRKIVGLVDWTNATIECMEKIHEYKLLDVGSENEALMKVLHSLKIGKQLPPDKIFYRTSITFLTRQRRLRMFCKPFVSLCTISFRISSKEANFKTGWQISSHQKIVWETVGERAIQKLRSRKECFTSLTLDHNDVKVSVR